MRPDVILKIAQIYTKGAKKEIIAVSLKIDVFTTAQKVTKYLSLFCKKICHQELSKSSKQITLVCLPILVTDKCKQFAEEKVQTQ